MEQVAHQTIVMQFILELAKSLKVDPRACFRQFFTKIKVASPGAGPGWGVALCGAPASVCSRGVRASTRTPSRGIGAYRSRGGQRRGGGGGRLPDSLKDRGEGRS